MRRERSGRFRCIREIRVPTLNLDARMPDSFGLGLHEASRRHAKERPDAIPTHCFFSSLLGLLAVRPGLDDTIASFPP